MRNLILILLFFGILACKENKVKQNSLPEIESPEKNEFKKNNDSYKKRSPNSLDLFFNRWKTESEKIKPKINDSLTSYLYQIFYEIYNPFELEKYGK